MCSTCSRLGLRRRASVTRSNTGQTCSESQVRLAMALLVHSVRARSQTEVTLIPPVPKLVKLQSNRGQTVVKLQSNWGPSSRSPLGKPGHPGWSSCLLPAWHSVGMQVAGG